MCFSLSVIMFFFVPYSQQPVYKYVAQSIFSCGQLYIDISIFSLINQHIQSDKTTKSSEFLNITPFGYAKVKVLGLATKIPKNGLKIFPKFLQKSSKNLRFHL